LHNNLIPYWLKQIRIAKEKWDKRKDRQRWSKDYVKSLQSIFDRAKQKKEQAK
jgi:hypothetical protein